MGDLTNAPAFAQQLQQASYAGVPFYYDGTSLAAPRKFQAHELPNQDFPIPEDLGAAAKTITIRAWVWGDDCFSQAADLQAACSQGTENELIDPVLGSMQAYCTNFGQEFSNRAGNMVSFSLTFCIVQDSSTYDDTTEQDTSQSLSDGSDDLDSTASDDFDDDVDDYTDEDGNFLNDVSDAATTVLTTASFVADAVVSTISDFITPVLAATTDVVAAINQIEGIGYAFSSISGWTGARFAFGNLSSPPAVLSGINYNQSAPDILKAATAALIGQAQANRATVSTAASTALGAVSQGQPVPAAIQALTEALRAALSPADAIRLLASLASFQPVLRVGTDPLSAEINKAIAATAALFRRACLSSLARAVSDYQPTSTSDAQNTIATCKAVFDAENLYASSVQDKSPLTIKRLMAFINKDQNTKASNLTPTRKVTINSPTPLKVIAMQLFGDAKRADDLLLMNPQIVHPAFVSGIIEAPLK